MGIFMFSVNPSRSCVPGACVCPFVNWVKSRKFSLTRLRERSSILVISLYRNQSSFLIITVSKENYRYSVKLFSLPPYIYNSSKRYPVTVRSICITILKFKSFLFLRTGLRVSKLPFKYSLLVKENHA